MKPQRQKAFSNHMDTLSAFRTLPGKCWNKQQLTFPSADGSTICQGGLSRPGVSLGHWTGNVTGISALPGEAVFLQVPGSLWEVFWVYATADMEHSDLIIKLLFVQPILIVLSHFSRVGLFVTPWTVGHQSPLSMGFCKQETGVGCHALLQGIFPTQGSNPHL